MMPLLIALESFLVAGAGFFFSYLALLSICAAVQTRRRPVQTGRRRKFAVVVPAHNEEHSIEQTLKSLKTLEYPVDLVRLIVVADNCTDDTAAVARRAGGEVFVRTDASLRGKGYALRWCFDRLADDRNDHDAVVVVDADSVVSTNFLSVMNDHLESGANAIQSSDLAADARGDWSTEMTRLSFLLHNFVRPLGRSLLRFSAGLKGNGMCFTRQTLVDVPWESYSTNEDLEYGMELLLRGIRVVFAPEAKVYATMPLASHNARTQRSRWERGRMPVIRKFAPALLKSAVRRPSVAAFDALVELLTPSLVNLGALTAAMGLVTAAIAVAGAVQMRIFAELWMLVGILAVVHIAVGLAVAGADVSAILALRHVPRYFFWKIWIYTGWIRNRPSQEWVRTTRESPVIPALREDVPSNKNSA